MAGRVLALLVALVAMASAIPTTLTAVAFMRETSQPGNLIIGHVHFYQDYPGGEVMVDTFTYGNADYFIANAQHGQYVSQLGDITRRDGSLTGNSFFVLGEGFPGHGCPPSENRRTGDMGNTPVNGLHQLMGTKVMDLLETYNGTNSIIGRAVITASAEDTCELGWNPIPNAFGVIGYAHKAPHNVGVQIVAPFRHLVAWMYGSGDWPLGQGEIWATQASENTINIIVKVYLPVGLPDSHWMTITEFGDITTKNGELMGATWTADGFANGDLGNSQYYTPYAPDATGTWKWMNKTIVGKLSQIAGRGFKIYESYKRTDRAGCKNGGAGGAVGFAVFGLADIGNDPPASFPANVIPVDFPLDDTFCASGVLGVSFTLFVSWLALFFVM